MDGPDIDGLPRRMHLFHQPKKTRQGGTIDYYSIAICYKDGAKNKKKILQRVGRLSREQAASYRMLLKAINEPSHVGQFCTLDQIMFKEERRYFDVLTIDAIWKKLGLASVFPADTNGNQKLATESVARILTINRLLAPTSKVGTISWLGSTLLPKILGFDLDAYGKTKIFRELDKIHARKPVIEKLFADFSARQKSDGVDVYFFDGTTSWFEGSKCDLAKYDLEKTRGFYPKVVALMLVTDKNGYPIAWDVEDGNTKDTSCFEALAQRVYRDYGVSEITYCFDRGIASLSNFRAATKCRAKFITGIKDNQIKAVFDLTAFEKTRAKLLDESKKNETIERRRIVEIDGFFSYGRDVFFRDLGITGGMRHIASFNVDAYQTESQARKKRLDECLKAISDKNIELAHAKKDRAFEVTERDLLAILTKYQARELLDYTLMPLNVDMNVQSFTIKCSLKRSKFEELGRTDGLMLYITDHIERDLKRGFQLHASEIIAYYKRKYIIENAFREMKSFLDLRPFHVWTEEHVKAHYDVAVIACFINNFILRSIDPIIDGDDMSLRSFYRLLNDAGAAVQLAAPSGVSIFKMKSPPAALKAILSRMGLAPVCSPSLHTSHGVYQ